MDCRKCQNLLDSLLIAEPTAAEHAELLTHVETCPECATQYALARQTLAAITQKAKLPVSPDLKERIMIAISDARVFDPAPTAIRIRRSRALKIVVLFAAAAGLLVAMTPLFRLGPSQKGPNVFSAFSVLAEACAAEEKQFSGNQIVHLVNEIVVTPVADATLAKIRWLPLVSLEPTGKMRFNQLTLPGEVDKGYTVDDQSWYDPATGRFARILTVGDRPIFANSYDGANICTLDIPAAGAAQVARQPVAKDFQPPKSPAEYLGLGAGLRSNVNEKTESLVSDVGKAVLSDGAEARVLKMGFPQGGPPEAAESYGLLTIRSDNNTIEKMEWFAQGKLFLAVRRVKAEPDKGPSVGWDLAGIAKQAVGAAAVPGPSIMANMVISDVSVEHMAKKADFTAYVFDKDPSWAGNRQIADILDIVSPPHRMFCTAYQAKDGRHVVLMQSYTYNKMLGPMVKMGKVIYTSPSGIKVWSGERDAWLANILLQSARASIKDQPGKELTGYMLETPADTFPALAINGKISEEELHTLIDSLVPANDGNAEKRGEKTGE